MKYETSLCLKSFFCFVCKVLVSVKSQTISQIWKLKQFRAADYQFNFLQTNPNFFSIENLNFFSIEILNFFSNENLNTIFFLEQIVFVRDRTNWFTLSLGCYFVLKLKTFFQKLIRNFFHFSFTSFNNMFGKSLYLDEQTNNCF